MNTNTDREAIKAKIAKLMALGTDTRANQFEAEAAMRQAAFLMRKHAIEQAEIFNTSGTTPAWDWYTINIPCDPVNGGVQAVAWFGQLAVHIARFTDTRAEWSRLDDYGMCVKFQGDATDVFYAAFLAKHLRDSIRSQSAAFVGTRREREDFRRAMVSRIGERMQALRQEQRESMRASASDSKALVFIDSKIAARDAQFGKFTTKRGTRRRVSEYGSSAGRAAGDRVGFGRPVTHTSPARAIAQGGAA